MIKVSRQDKTVNSIISLDPSKSITNRLLIIRALSEEKFDIRNSSNAEDSLILKDVLENLSPEINVKDAGTAFRFLTAYLSIQPGSFTLTGSERMRQRPIGRLVQSLKSIRADINFIEKENFPPLKINGKNLDGGKINIDASESSQFISALLLIAPKLNNGLKLELVGKINSSSYIEMTISLMKSFGVSVTKKNNFIEVQRQEYSPVLFEVENDWSSASFWYEVMALSNGGEIILKGLTKNSIQGDSIIDDIMKNFGVISETKGKDILIKKNKMSRLPEFFEYDFSTCPDLVLPVAVVCSALKIKSKFKGVRNLRIKESDRLQSLKNELEKIDVKIILDEDSFQIQPCSGNNMEKKFSTYNDHRMIMSLAPLALVYDEIILDDHIPVKKSYPSFWEQMSGAGFECKSI